MFYGLGLILSYQKIWNKINESYLQRCLEPFPYGMDCRIGIGQRKDEMLISKNGLKI